MSVVNADNFKNRVWAEIDLDALVHNYTEVRSHLKPETKILAVVKANAYGHGAPVCAKTLLEAGADYLGVATLEEAMELRHQKIYAPILILGYVPIDEADALVANDLTATVYTKEFAKVLSRQAKKQNKICNVHIKVNTGMERLGFESTDIEEIKSIFSLPNLSVEGIFSHLACADAEDSSSVHTQYKKFIKVTETLKEAGFSIPLRHILNSAGVLDFPAYQLEMVRPGIILYGYYPSSCIKNRKADLQPVLTLKTRIIHLHTAPKGAGVSYGWAHTTEKPTVIATLPIGYADGFSRKLSGRGEMLAGGHRVPILGKICMDQCMIDVSSVNTINIEDEIIIIGKQGEETISAETLATLTDSISYEILCATGKRVPRLYKKGNTVVGVLNGFA